MNRAEGPHDKTVRSEEGLHLVIVLDEIVNVGQFKALVELAGNVDEGHFQRSPHDLFVHLGVVAELVRRIDLDLEPTAGLLLDGFLELELVLRGLVFHGALTTMLI